MDKSLSHDDYQPLLRIINDISTVTVVEHGLLINQFSYFDDNIHVVINDKG